MEAATKYQDSMATDYQGMAFLNAFLRYLSTGNVLLDVMLQGLVATLLAMLLHRKASIVEHCKNVFGFKAMVSKFNIELEGIIIEERWQIFTNFSDRFEAVTQRLQREISLARKLPSTPNHAHVTLLEAPKPSYGVSAMEYLPLCGTKVIIDDIVCSVHIQNGSTENITSKRITFQLSSNANMQCILDFIEDSLTLMKESKLDKIHAKQCFFLYDGVVESTQQLAFVQGDFKTSKSFDNLFFGGRQQLLDRVHHLESEKDQYERLGIPRTLGILLHGAPGVGKTSIVKSLAALTKRHPIIVRMNKLHTLSQLRRLFMEKSFNGMELPMDRRLYVFEEMDCNGQLAVLEDRELVKKQEERLNSQISALVKANCGGASDAESKNKCSDDSILASAVMPKNKDLDKDDAITLGGFLELLDGLIEMPGRLIVITSNHPEKLDRALLRPGRIDVNLELKLASQADINDIFRLWYRADIPDAELKNVPDKKLSHAAVSELFWNSSTASDAVAKLMHFKS